MIRRIVQNIILAITPSHLLAIVVKFLTPIFDNSHIAVSVIVIRYYFFGPCREQKSKTE